MDCTRSTSSTRRRRRGSDGWSHAQDRIGRRTHLERNSSPAIQTRPSTTIVIQGTSRARNLRNPRIRSMPVGIRRRFHFPMAWSLVVGGFDQDNSVAPDPNRVAKGRQNIPQTDTAFTATRVNQVVPEVYDPKTDRNIALENARMAFPLYPQLEVVQTGPEETTGRFVPMTVKRTMATSQYLAAQSSVSAEARRLYQGDNLVPGRVGANEGSQPERSREETTGRLSTLPRRSGPTVVPRRA
jgi:hypothetical protein